MRTTVFSDQQLVSESSVIPHIESLHKFPKNQHIDRRVAFRVGWAGEMSDPAATQFGTLGLIEYNLYINTLSVPSTASGTLIGESGSPFQKPGRKLSKERKGRAI